MKLYTTLTLTEACQLQKQSFRKETSQKSFCKLLVNPYVNFTLSRAPFGAGMLARYANFSRHVLKPGTPECRVGLNGLWLGLNGRE